MSPEKEIKALFYKNNTFFKMTVFPVVVPLHDSTRALKLQITNGQMTSEMIKQ